MDMEVSINGGAPTWMIYDGKSQSTMDDLGVPALMETPKWLASILHLNRIFNYKPSILGYPRVMDTPSLCLWTTPVLVAPFSDIYI